jgi:hypothetical protein
MKLLNCRPFCFAPVLLATAALWAAVPAARTLTIKPVEEKVPAVQITVDGARIRVVVGNELLLSGETKDGQKRRYSGKDGVFAAEVKMGEPDGFKVRTQAGKLLWKIKTADAKTKVSDNEENKGGYEMARKRGVVRVVKDEQLLGTFEFGPAVEAGGSGATRIKDPNGRVLFTAEPAGGSLAGGVMLMTAVPVELRYIIMAELLARSY